MDSAARRLGFGRSHSITGDRPGDAPHHEGGAARLARAVRAYFRDVFNFLGPKPEDEAYYNNTLGFPTRFDLWR